MPVFIFFTKMLQVLDWKLLEDVADDSSNDLQFRPTARQQNCFFVSLPGTWENCNATVKNTANSRKILKEPFPIVF
jgi:hypothetical protein